MYECKMYMKVHALQQSVFVERVMRGKQFIFPFFTKLGVISFNIFLQLSRNSNIFLVV